MSDWSAPTTPPPPPADSEVIVLVTEELGPGPLAGTSLRVHRQWWQLGHGPMAADDIAAELTAKDPAAVVLGDDVPLALALDLSRLLDRDRADIGVLLLREPSPELWSEAARSGVRDVIDPELAEEELEPALQIAVERHRRLRSEIHAMAVPESATPRMGRIISVLSPKGGSGKTMVASNLAVAMAAAGAGSVVLVDLDCIFGDVSSVMGMVPEHTIGELAKLPSFDATLLKVYLGRHDPSGTWVLAGSPSPEEGEEVTDDLARQVLDLLAREFKYVVVDTAAGLDERALAAIEMSNDVVFVASMDVASIRNLGKEINALDRLGMVDARRHFVLNRADARVGLEVHDVETVLSMRVTEALPSSRLVPLSMNQGRPIVLEDPSSTVSQPLLNLAAQFTGVNELAEARRGRRGRRKR